MHSVELILNNTANSEQSWKPALGRESGIKRGLLMRKKNIGKNLVTQSSYGMIRLSSGNLPHRRTLGVPWRGLELVSFRGRSAPAQVRFISVLVQVKFSSSQLQYRSDSFKVSFSPRQIHPSSFQLWSDSALVSISGQIQLRSLQSR